MNGELHQVVAFLLYVNYKLFSGDVTSFDHLHFIAIKNYYVGIVLQCNNITMCLLFDF